MARFTSTSKPLAANGVFVSDILNITSEDAVSGTVTASHPGTLYAEFSASGGQTWTVKETFNVAANTPLPIKVNTTPPYARLRYVNGGTAQTSFTLTVRASDPGSRNPTRGSGSGSSGGSTDAPTTSQFNAAVARIAALEAKQAPVLYTENFSTESFANYVADQGTSKTGMSFTGAAATVTDANDHSIHNNQDFFNGKVLMKSYAGDSGGERILYLTPKFVNDNNFLMMQYHSAAGNMTLYAFNSGSATSYGTFSIPPWSPTVPIWWVMRISNNNVIAQTFTMDPRSNGATAYSQLSVTLSGNAATQLGSGVTGKVGMRIKSVGTANKIRVEELVVAGPEPTTNTNW